MTQFHDDLQTLAAPVVVNRLGKALGAIAQGPLRLAYLEERLRAAPIAPMVKMLACAQRESVRGVVPARFVVESFTILLDDRRLEPSAQAALTATALALGEDAVVALVENPAANDLPGGQGSAARVKTGSLAEAGETLGRRKSLARTVTGVMLTKVLDDPDAQVIQQVLMNPHVTEAHALRVAARRPVPSAILEVLARSRFANVLLIRRAIVLNPDCPLKLAQRLVSTMLPADLKEVLQANGPAKEVKAVARRLLGPR